MNKETPVLTIAIATYNRPKQLSKTLDLLEQQTNKNFKVFISDNCSNYNVADVISGRSKEFTNRISLHINSVNIGAMGNFCKLLDSSDEGYLWILGDDDTINVNAVETILSYIEKYPDSCFFEFPVFKNMNIVPGDMIFNSLREYIDFFYIHRKQINITTFGELAFMSNKVYKVECLKDCFQTFYDRLNTRMPSTIIVFKLLALCGKGVLACERILSHGQEGSPTNTWNNIKVIQGTKIFLDEDFGLDKRQLRKMLELVSPPWFIITQNGIGNERSFYKYIAYKLFYKTVYKYHSNSRDKMRVRFLIWLHKNNFNYKIFLFAKKIKKKFFK